MYFRHEDREHQTCLLVSGELDAYTSPRLTPILDEIVARRRVSIVIDFSQLDFIDSVGVAAIVSLLKRARRYGGDVLVVNAKNQPRAMLELLRLDVLFPRASQGESWALA
jgi:anti-sigma B factor antagonist